MLFDIKDKVEATFSEHFDYEKTYYLSGPMAGYPEHNFPAFEAAAVDLREHKVNVLAPNEVQRPGLSGKPEEWSEYLRNDLIEMLRHCDGIILLRGWPQSQGANLELHIAMKLGWPAYYYDKGLLVCLNRRN